MSVLYVKYLVNRKSVIDKLIQPCACYDRLYIIDTYPINSFADVCPVSDNTSSSKSIGVSCVASLTSSISDNFKDRAAVLCCPWEPYLRISISPVRNPMSSLCGPTVVLFILRSLSRYRFSACSNGRSPVLGSYMICRLLCRRSASDGSSQ